MDIDLDNHECIDPGEHEELLRDLQGNILKGHGREMVRLVPVTFTGEAAKARSWVRAFGRGWVTGASLQDQQAAGWRNEKVDSLFANLFLTCPGYRYIGVEDPQIPTDLRFRAGMIESRERLNDPPGDAWDPPYDPVARPIHAMALLAASTPAVLEKGVKQVTDSLAFIHADFRVQPGQALSARNANHGVADGGYVEHLNYLDGRSQPVFLRQDFDRETADGGTDKYNPFAPLRLVLVKEPQTSADRPTGYGSYLVYRKLEQNVRGFKERERKPDDVKSPSLADQLGLGGDARKRAGAMALGRFENGTPAALSATDSVEGQWPPGSLTSAPNNFNYDNDPKGTKCPVFAHIRKVNPRTPESRQHRIVRRGITYDDIGRAAPPSDEAQPYAQMPTGGVGLLFMCFQSSIGDQFEHLQGSANDASAGMDPLVGQAGNGGSLICRWPKKWGAEDFLAEPFGGFVCLKGGEYFFAPSKSFFQGLSL